MTRADAAQFLERRKKVRLRARPNLQITSRYQGGRRFHVVKDPVALQYYHLAEPQKFALDHMDGNHTLEQIQQSFEREYKPQRLSFEELEGFASQLLQYGLIENDNASSGQLLFARIENQRHLRQWSKLANLFYFKIPLLRSTRCLDMLLPVGRVLFHPVAVLAALVFLLSGVGLILTRWNDFLDRLPAYQDLFSLESVLYLWCAIGLVKIFHELGHALCARTFGSEVYDFGVVFMFFFPTLYCNVSDCWMLPQKWKRMAVGAAGIYVELLIMAAAVWIWWASTPATVLHQFSFWLILTCSVHTFLFNANPLMRFDGYFILSDLLDIPNLSEAAGRQVWNRLGSWLGYESPRSFAAERRNFLLVFGLASFMYRCFVIGSMMYLFHQFMKEHGLELLGLTVVLLALLGMVAWPAYRLAQSLGQFRRVSPMNLWRFWSSLAAAGGLLAVFFLVPFPMKVHGVGLVQVECGYQQAVQVPAPGGVLMQTFARDGQRVQKGDVLAVLRNPQMNLDLRLNEADLTLRTDQYQALLGQLAVHDDAGAPWDSRTEIQQELHTLAQQHVQLKARVEDLILRTPCDGTLIGFPSWELLGKWLAEGTPFCQVGNERQLRLLILLEPADRQLVDSGKTIRFRGHGSSSVTWQGKVSAVAQVDARDIPVQLSHRLGGDVASKPDPVNKTEKPDRQQYLVSAKLDDVDRRVQIGALGEVRIAAESKTLWWRLRRYLGSTFHWGL